MVCSELNTNNFTVSCNCGCQEGMEFRFEKETDYITDHEDKAVTEYYISLSTSKWDADQEHGFERLKYVLRKIWTIVRGKDFYYSEIVLTSEQWKQFKDKVNEVE